jgi:hypothetical protein
LFYNIFICFEIEIDRIQPCEIEIDAVNTSFGIRVSLQKQNYLAPNAERITTLIFFFNILFLVENKFFLKYGNSSRR